MLYWFDTEFHEHDRIIDLISIGIVAEDGRQYYAENANFDNSNMDPWITENVIDKLAGPAKPLQDIRTDLYHFFQPAPTELWAWFGEYDWIVLRQLFGHMLDWPKDWPLSHMNLEQLRLSLGSPKLPPQPLNAHHALADAIWCKKAWENLKELKV